MFAAQDWVNHSQKEYVRGEAHNNTAESFNANLERAKLGVFHYMSKKHLARYLHEVCFRMQWHPKFELHNLKPFYWL
ncbi:transposase [Desulfatitalea tepidiphila]|uniref:transposase n=1 Tax=Desulfatitalea tepidiphila TaxID=1185843 RepID=UPI0009758843